MSERNIELVQSAFDAFSARDLKALLEVVDPEIEFFPLTRALANRAEPYRGHEGIRTYLQDVASVWEELEVIPRRFSHGDDHVVVYGRVRGRTSGGALVDSPADWIWKIRAGKIAWGCVYGKRDAALAMEVAGIAAASSSDT
jgi:ketosteroid isomerase-like protein